MMRITIKFMSSLMEYLPPEANGAELTLEVATAVTPHQLVDRYKIPRAQIQVMLRNGVFLPPPARDQGLQNGDTLSVWPAIQGG